MDFVSFFEKKIANVLILWYNPLNMENYTIKSAEFVTSVVKKENVLTDRPEIAFVGRSNAGKSTFINTIVGQKHLAKTSSTPGLTKMLNYFLINKSIYFVDLPGYGVSKTGKKHQEIWSELIGDYLATSKRLSLVFMLVDIRNKPSELDHMMLKFLYLNNIPFRIIATKCDKIAKSKIHQYLQVIAKEFQITVNNIIPYSAETFLNKQKILDIIGEIDE